MIGGKLWCWLLKRHRWGKAKYEHLGGGVYATVGGFKTCRRCSLTKEVKRRAKQEKGI